MPAYSRIFLRIFTTALLACSLASCGLGPQGERFENDDGGARRANTFGGIGRGPEIVHIDNGQRVVTLRANGNNLDGTFYFSVDRSGDRTGVLKLITMAPGAELRTADILDGRPAINNRVVEAEADESARLAGLYPEGEDGLERSSP